MKSFVRAFGALFFNQAAAEEEEAAAVAAEQPKPMVLLIDDDKDLLDVLRAVVRAAGFNVLATSSAAKGLDMLRFTRNNVGLVVLDYSMPSLNGADTLVHLRKLSPAAKVIGLTGIKSDELPESFSRGVDRLIAKPCPNAQLVENIRNMLGIVPVAATA